MPTPAIPNQPPSLVFHETNCVYNGQKFYRYCLGYYTSSFEATDIYVL